MRAWRQESESLAIRNLFGGKEDILLKASVMAKRSAVNDGVMGGSLLEKEMWNSSI